MWNGFPAARIQKFFCKPPTKVLLGNWKMLRICFLFCLFFSCWVATERIANWPVTGSLKGPWSCPSGGPWISIRPCGRNLYSSVRSVSSCPAKPTATTKKRKKKKNGESRNRIISCRSSADGGCASATISDGLWFSYSRWLCSNISGSPSRRNSPIIPQIISHNPTTGSLSYLIRFQWPSIGASRNLIILCVCLSVLRRRKINTVRQPTWVCVCVCVRGQCVCVCVCDSPYFLSYTSGGPVWFCFLCRNSIPRLSDYGRRR